MSRLWFAVMMVLTIGLAVAGCRLEADVDDATSITAPH
jgi:hypothetical protein